MSNPLLCTPEVSKALSLLSCAANGIRLKRILLRIELSSETMPMTMEGLTGIASVALQRDARSVLCGPPASPWDSLTFLSRLFPVSGLLVETGPSLGIQTALYRRY